MTRETLKEKLDHFWWKKVNRTRWYSQDALRDFVRILCDILKVEKCDIHFCSTDRFLQCMAKKGIQPPNQPCGGACYNMMDKCIYFRDIIGWSLVLEELFHHIDRMNNHEAIKKVMWAWYNSLTQKQKYRHYFNNPELKTVERRKKRKKKRTRTKRRR